MRHLLISLNEAQKEAVLQVNGPVMIIAGPGSGKTRVISHKIAWLIKNGIDPYRIISLTFTNKAANEMKERIINLVGDEARNVWMGTFHSIFARILRKEAQLIGYQSNFTIYDPDDSKTLIKQIIKENNLPDNTYKPSVVLFYIVNAKMQMITPDQYLNDDETQIRDNKSNRPLLGLIYKKYWDRCRRINVMDFEDLLLNTVLLFRNHPKTLEKYQNQLQYILVDEYQDTCYSQYLIIKALALKHRNISVVGDDAQSIYSFRGARIENIYQFLKDFPDTKLIKLEQNYRSTQVIVEAANALINNNSSNIEKKLWSNNEKGEKIKIFKCLNDLDEAKQIAQYIFQTKMNNQLNNSDFAVLYRTHSQSRIIEETFIKFNIPYKIYGSLSFYKRKEIKDALAYFRLLINPSDEDAFMRVINTPTRGIGLQSIDKLLFFTHVRNLDIWHSVKNILSLHSEIGISKHIALKIDAFANLIESIRIQMKQKDAFEIASKILKQSGYIQMYKDSDNSEDQERFENIQELINAIRFFVENQKISSPNKIPTLVEYLTQVSLLTDLDEDEQNKDVVKLMTVHAAKGLEFPYVFIVGAEENLFPTSQSSLTRKELEEERRLFYVAITRAIKQVVISYTESRLRWGDHFYNEPSRFIFEIEQDLLAFPSKDLFSLHKTRDNALPKNSINIAIPKFQELEINNKKLRKVSEYNSSQTQSDLFDSVVPGVYVEHSIFGQGKVIQIDGTGDNKKAIVAFDNYGNKNLLLRFARLKIIS